MTGDDADNDIVDMVFSLSGGPIAADYADLLWESLRVAQPWLEDEASLGIQPLGRIGQGAECIFLSRHSRLVLRLPQARVDAVRRLTGAKLDLGGPVTVGAGKVKKLQAARVLYSSCVLTGAADEVSFVAACRRMLEGILPASAGLVVGKPQRLRVAGREEQGYGLMVHGFSPEESLCLQRSGLGAQHRHGCGVFVEHRSVAPVGA